MPVSDLEGAEAVKFYGVWAQTNQSILYEDEQVAVADNFIASVSTMYQQTHGKTLAANGACRSTTRMPTT